MPRRRNFDLEKIHASLVTACPYCSARIEPDELKRVDWDHVECPKCGKRFIQGRVRYTSMHVDKRCVRDIVSDGRSSSHSLGYWSALENWKTACFRKRQAAKFSEFRNQGVLDVKNNGLFRLDCFLIVTLIVATAGVLHYSPTVRAQPPIPSCFEHSRGRFQLEGFTWQEYYDGKATYKFIGNGSDGNFLYVVDSSRNLTLALPRAGGQSLVRVGDGPWTNGYQVQAGCSAATPKSTLQTATTGVLTVPHAHGECRTDQCYQSGATIVDAMNYCSSCVTLTAYMPLTAQVANIHCLTTATTNGGDDSASIREVPCGALDGWATFDRPEQSTTPTNTIVRTVFHNRSHNRARDVELQVDYR